MHILIGFYRILSKKVGCMAFAPNGQSILLGEKSGYVIYFPISGDTTDQRNANEHDEVLGHISLLTSVVSISFYLNFVRLSVMMVAI